MSLIWKHGLSLLQSESLSLKRLHLMHQLQITHFRRVHTPVLPLQCCELDESVDEERVFVETTFNTKMSHNRVMRGLCLMKPQKALNKIKAKPSGVVDLSRSMCSKNIEVTIR